jgi:hypothetical protein
VLHKGNGTVIYERDRYGRTLIRWRLPDGTITEPVPLDFLDLLIALLDDGHSLDEVFRALAMIQPSDAGPSGAHLTPETAEGGN